MAGAHSGVGMVAVPQSARLAAVTVILTMAGCADSTSPSTPTHLTFVVQPSAVGVATTVTPAIVVAAQDDAERTVSSWTDTVRLALESDDGSEALLGTTNVAAVSGTAVFEDLHIDGSGAGYRLAATSADLVPAVSRPFTVHDVFVASAVAAGDEHTCALLADGSAYCWGRNAGGRLGDGTVEDRSMPTSVSTTLRFTAIAVGQGHSCGLTSGGVAHCWGRNGYGQLGNGTSDSALTPNEVVFGSPFVALDAGYYHTCGLTADGGAQCWGDNSYGQLGDGTDSTRTTPTAVAGGLVFVSISAGYLHTCGLTTDRVAYCWGGNVYAELGDGTYERRLVPTAVFGDHRFALLNAGGGPCHGKTCGITPNGVTLCWGHNYQDGPRRRTTPTALDGDPSFASVVTGPLAVCGITAEGALYCWGQGLYGQVGNGTAGDVTIPTPIQPDRGFASVSLGGAHTCGLTTEGIAYCWGSNGSGQLGSGSNPAGWAIPVRVWKP
ncbi:MAG: hypothetical protein JSW71_03780 [Gemmatimonadota bacterium]|nr:MAG: hypothetical protein JSW71_03780 [Gemmatimonadota bacterium]